MKYLLRVELEHVSSPDVVSETGSLVGLDLLARYRIERAGFDRRPG